MRIYLAGPLFTESERSWLQGVKGDIEALAESTKLEIEVVWPYELFTPEELQSLGHHASREIFRRCREALDSCDILIALLDGSQVDDGTAWEIGYFYGRSNDDPQIIGIRTDFRKAGETQDSVVNSMIENSCSTIVHTSGQAAESVWWILSQSPDSGRNHSQE